jgi:hypothetical protein
MTPLDIAYDQVKEAAIPSAVADVAMELKSGFGGQFVDALKGAGALALAGAALGGMTQAAQALHAAATKSHDYNQMMGMHPDLKEHPNQTLVANAFTTLRRFSPAFSKDPLVAGSYVKRIVMNPDAAGGLINESLGASSKIESVMAQQALLAGQQGLKYKDPRELMAKDLSHQRAIEGIHQEGRESLLGKQQGFQAEQNALQNRLQATMANKMRAQSRREGVLNRGAQINLQGLRADDTWAQAVGEQQHRVDEAEAQEEMLRTDPNFTGRIRLTLPTHRPWTPPRP